MNNANVVLNNILETSKITVTKGSYDWTIGVQVRESRASDRYLSALLHSVASLVELELVDTNATVELRVLSDVSGIVIVAIPWNDLESELEVGNAVKKVVGE